jgi:hypothetical protein
LSVSQEDILKVADLLRFLVDHASELKRQISRSGKIRSAPIYGVDTVT